MDKEAVNAIDFVGIEAIRIFTPNVYLEMTGKKEIFTGKYIKGKHDDRKKRIERAIENAPQGLRETVREVICDLFPEVKRHYSEPGTDFSEEEVLVWKEELRVCSGDIFDKYFSLSIIPEGTIKNFLSLIEKFGKTRVGLEHKLTWDDLQMKQFNKQTKELEDEFAKQIREKLEKLKGIGQLRLFIGELVGRLKFLSEWGPSSLLITIFDYVKSEVMEDVASTWHGANEAQNVYEQVDELGRYILNLTKFGDTEVTSTARANILTTIAKSVEDISFPIKLTSHLESNLDLGLTSRGNLIELRPELLEGIKKAKKNNTLQKSIWFYETLCYWEETEKKKVKEYIAELLKANTGVDDGLLDFLKGMAVWSTIPKYGYAKTVRGVDRKRIKEFTNIDKLDKRISKLSEKERKGHKIIELYLEAKEATEKKA